MPTSSHVEGQKALTSLPENHCREGDSSFSPGQISVIGIGPGSLELLSPEGKKELERVQTVIGYQLYIRLIEPLLKDKRVIAYKMREEVARGEEAINLALDGEQVALVCSGDPGVYGMAGLLLELLRRGVLEHTDIKVFGYLKREEKLKIPERHLGLQTYQEISSMKELCQRVASLVSKTVDLEELFSTAQRAEVLHSSMDIFADVEEGALSCRIGVAYDEAFSFYYQDNLDLLRAAGADLVFFGSPPNLYSRKPAGGAKRRP